MLHFDFDVPERYNNEVLVTILAPGNTLLFVGVT